MARRKTAKSPRPWYVRVFRYSFFAGLAGLFGKKGAFSGGWTPYKAFYTHGFHPWQQDTRELLVQWAAEPQLAST